MQKLHISYNRHFYGENDHHYKPSTNCWGKVGQNKHILVANCKTNPIIAQSQFPCWWSVRRAADSCSSESELLAWRPYNLVALRFSSDPSQDTQKSLYIRIKTMWSCSVQDGFKLQGDSWIPRLIHQALGSWYLSNSVFLNAPKKNPRQESISNCIAMQLHTITANAESCLPRFLKGKSTRKFPQGVLPSIVAPATRKRPSDTKQHSEARAKFRMGLNTRLDMVH